jgi:hypothetical protein
MGSGGIAPRIFNLIWDGCDLHAPPISQVLCSDTELASLCNLTGDYKVQNLKEMQIHVLKQTAAN